MNMIEVKLILSHFINIKSFISMNNELNNKHKFFLNLRSIKKNFT